MDNPMRRATVESLIDKTGNFFLGVDARVEGVRLPDFLLQCENVVLQFGKDIPNPTNLFTTDKGVESTLSFDGAPFCCELPWLSIRYAMTKGFMATFDPTGEEVIEEEDLEETAEDPDPAPHLTLV